MHVTCNACTQDNDSPSGKHAHPLLLQQWIFYSNYVFRNFPEFLNTILSYTYFFLYKASRGDTNFLCSNDKAIFTVNC